MYNAVACTLRASFQGGYFYEESPTYVSELICGVTSATTSNPGNTTQGSDLMENSTYVGLYNMTSNLTNYLLSNVSATLGYTFATDDIGLSTTPSIKTFARTFSEEDYMFPSNLSVSNYTFRFTSNYTSNATVMGLNETFPTDSNCVRVVKRIMPPYKEGKESSHFFNFFTSSTVFMERVVIGFDRNLPIC